MKEIRFRGKRKYGNGLVPDGKWAYGVPLECKVSGVFMVWAERKTIRKNGVVALKDNVEQAEIEPNTVGQYTGLLDKNGVEIYEGDVVEGVDFTGDLVRGFVEYGDAAYFINSGTWNPSLRSLRKNIEVIGNIYEVSL